MIQNHLILFIYIFLCLNIFQQNWATSPSSNFSDWFSPVQEFNVWIENEDSGCLVVRLVDDGSGAGVGVVAGGPGYKVHLVVARWFCTFLCWNIFCISFISDLRIRMLGLIFGLNLFLLSLLYILLSGLKICDVALAPSPYLFVLFCRGKMVGIESKKTGSELVSAKIEE